QKLNTGLHHSDQGLKQQALCDFDKSGTEQFWQQATALQGSITPHVLPNVLLIGIIATAICFLEAFVEKYFHFRLAISVAPYEMVGAALGLLLVLRTNSGYDRWWEARKLWGGIVNQSRNLAIMALTYGPSDVIWRKRMVSLACAFPNVARISLRGEKTYSELIHLLGETETARVASAEHTPTAVAFAMAQLLREAIEKHGMDRFVFLQIDRERAELVNHIGACERILTTPLALAYSIKIRRFIALFLISLPFALIHSLNYIWLVPLVTMLVAYPLLSLDQLGVELQNPFSKMNLSHLPLDEICQTIEGNLEGVFDFSDKRSQENNLLVI
ncbi:MAG: hypothetical protein K2X29_14585, partial [Candidatus Obscuribacterales bacterium]|nr:hypothetical protein [Candidatus Obscuribacterales bacterium]